MTQPIGLVANTVLQFRRAKIMTLAALTAALQCSRSTAQRRLKQWRCHTSYNLNGAYYALPEVVSFDQHGIWRCHHAGFSVYGNLTHTVVGLVTASEAGLNCAELSNIMDVNAHSFIWNFVRSGKLARSKFGRYYVYFSAEQQVHQRQQTRRLELTEGTAIADSDAVTALVELLKHPNLSPAQLSSRVRARAPTASPAAIERFLCQHGLSTAKKGGPDSPS